MIVPFDLTVLNQEFFGNSLQQYIVATAAFLLVFWVLKLFKKQVISNLHKLSDKTKTDIDDLIVSIVQSIGSPFYVFVSLGVGVQFIEQPPLLKNIILYIALAVVIYTVVRAVQQLVDYTFNRAIKKRLDEDSKFDDSVIRLFASAVKAVVWVVAILIVLQNLGYNITALVAGLGIGGIAIAFALQNVLSDIFASFSIYLDKPFRTGDFIIVDDLLGTVKHIGIKSTRIESLWGEEIIIPNKALTEARIKNYKNMENRRLVFGFGVTYQTPAEKLKKIPEIVKEIVADIKLAEIDRVHFKAFGDSSLNFEVMYHVDSPEYNDYMDIQQEINLKLKERFEREGIEFAYPTQTIFIEKTN